MAMQRRTRVAVVGGGIAGLACARALLAAQPALDVTVYEGSPVVGGKLALGDVGGVTVDLGAESMLSRRPEGTGLAEAVGLADCVVHPAVSGAGVWTGGTLRPLPPTVMGIPTALSATARSGVLSRRAIVRAALEPRLPRLELAADVGVGGLVATRLGRAVRDRLVEPLLGGVYAGRSDEISLYAALPQLVRAVAHHGGLLTAAQALAAGESPDTGATAAGPVFAGIRGGIGRLPAAVVDDVSHRGGVVLRNATVREIRREASGWRLTFGSGGRATSASADIVVLATPAAPTSRLLRDVAPVAAHELAEIEYASIAIVTLAWPADQTAIGLRGSGFLVPPVDGRLIKAATYSSQKWSWQGDDVAVIRCSVGRHRDEATLQRDDGELVEGVRSDLREAIGLQPPPVDTRVTRWGGALPQYAVGHLDRVRRLRAAVEATPGLDVCGAAYDGVGVPAAIASGQQAATRVLTELRSVATMEP